MLDKLAALPTSAWRSAPTDRVWRYRHPQLHEDTVTIKGIARPVRQIALRNTRREEPTLLITAHTTTSVKDLFARYAERMLVENDHPRHVRGHHRSGPREVPAGGPRTVSALLTLRDQIVIPILAGVHNPRLGQKPSPWTIPDGHYERLRIGNGGLVQ